MKPANTVVTKTKSIVEAVTMAVAYEDGDSWTAWLLGIDFDLWDTVILNNEHSSRHKSADSVESMWDYKAGRITAEQAGIPF